MSNSISRSARTSWTTFDWSNRPSARKNFSFFSFSFFSSFCPITLVTLTHPEDLASCKWSSGGSDNLQMIIWRIRPLANDHPEDPASCKWSSGGSGLLQMIIQQIQPLANDHMEVQATCKWSSGGSDHLQMIIQRTRPLANDHPEHLASGMWSSGGTGLLQMIIWWDGPLANDHPSTPSPLSPLPGSRINLADLSRTICSCSHFQILCDDQSGFRGFPSNFAEKEIVSWNFN